MSRDTKEARATIRTLLKGLAASVAVAVAVSWVLSTVIRDAASTTQVAPAPANVAPAPANDRAAALGERGSDKLRTPVEGNSDSPAVRGSSDLHSEVPDSFEAYSDDFTAGEPIPPEMLKKLEHAKGLLFDEANIKQGR